LAGFKYKAFISYSHKDKAWANWLHRRLESYTFPKNLTGFQTTSGEVPRNLRPIFRDREELAAGHNLGEKIEAALKASENLIIICSPSAAKSHWVNEEILYFKRHNRDAKIYSIIVEGEPFGTNFDLADQECFPVGLRYELGGDGTLSEQQAEPLAADLRESGDGKRLGVLKLISGMVGLGVNDLVQRDLQRARRRVTAITASAATIVLAMGGLTWTAVDARQEAELRRNDAEGQIEFMLTDLKAELEGVGRLDALQAVGDRAASYYDQYPLTEHDDDALGRRARVYHYLGDVQDKLGNLDAAEEHFQNAFDATSGLLERNPNNSDRVFDHSQSVYYFAYSLWKLEKYEESKPYFDDYIKLAEKLNELEPDALRSKQELAYANVNYGILLQREGKLDEAYHRYAAAFKSFQIIAETDEKNLQFIYDVAEVSGWLADILKDQERLKEAKIHRQEQIIYYNFILENDPTSTKALYKKLTAEVGLARILLLRGEIEISRALVMGSYDKSHKLRLSDSTNSDWAENAIYLALIGLEIGNQLGDLEMSKFYRMELQDIIKTVPVSLMREASILELSIKRALVPTKNDL